MLTLGEIFAALKSMADLGASPAVQQVFLQLAAKLHGVSPAALAAAAAAERVVQVPTDTDILNQSQALPLPR